MQLRAFTSHGDLGPSVEQLQAIVNTLPALIWTGRADGSGVDVANRLFLNYTSLEAAQLLGWGGPRPSIRTIEVDCWRRW